MAQQSHNASGALYLSFCYSYGIGTVRDEYSALQWCMQAADRGSMSAKSVGKMLYDAYTNTDTTHELEDLRQIGEKSELYLLEALQCIEQTSPDRMSDDMTRICRYICSSYPSVYAGVVYPGMRWPVVDQLLQVFTSEFHFLSPTGIVDYRLYQKTLAFATNMQYQFPLADGSSILHCLTYVVCPNETYLPMLAAIVVASGSNITVARNDGKTALELAVQFGSTAFVSVLLDTYIALGINSCVVRPLISRTVEFHHYDVCQMLSKYITYDETCQPRPFASDLLAYALKLPKVERIFTRGKEIFSDGQHLLDCLNSFGDGQTFTTENSKLLEAVKNAVVSGNDDILSYNNWTILRALSQPAVHEILELGIDLGEITLLKNMFHLSKLDHLSALELLKRAFQNPMAANVPIAEIILEYYPVSEDEYVIDLIESGSSTTNLLSKIVFRNPRILSRRFGAQQQSLLHRAIISRRLDTAKLLFNHGAVINIQDDDGNTPLHVAVESSNEACLAWLLSLPDITDIEARNKFGQTPLLYATNLGNLQAVQLLLEHHANVTTATNEGYTALHLAYSRYCKRTFRSLRGTMPDLVAKMEERKAREILSGTLNILKAYSADEDAVEHMMGFNPKSYFAWLLETMAKKKE